MEKLLIGKYVNTHGINGEIRIRSNFKYKERVFVVGNIIYIKDKEFRIKSYRVHKEYDMITLDGINNINDILYLKGSLVYIDKYTLNLKKDEYLDSDLIGFDVYTNNDLIGKIDDINYLTKNKKLLVVNSKLIPFELVKKIDIDNSKIIIEKVDGLL